MLREGDDPVVVSGAPGELALFLFGRAQHAGLDFDGPDDRVTALPSRRSLARPEPPRGSAPESAARTTGNPRGWRSQVS